MAAYGIENEWMNEIWGRNGSTALRLKKDHIYGFVQKIKWNAVVSRENGNQADYGRSEQLMALLVNMRI